MIGTSRVAGIASIVFAVVGIAWFALEGTPVRLGFEDTDDPSLMVRFIREHPEVFVQAGMLMLLMSISLVTAVLAVADLLAPKAGGLTLRTTSALGMFGAALFLFGGAVRVGSSGPLLHMSSLRAEWGEAAYVAAQVVSQAVLIGGILAVSAWAVGLSVLGLRTRTLPLALCLLGIVPAYRVAGVTLGALGVLGDADILWVLGIVSILGTIIWCLALGVVLIRRSLRPFADDAAAPAPVAV